MKKEVVTKPPQESQRVALIFKLLMILTFCAPVSGYIVLHFKSPQPRSPQLESLMVQNLRSYAKSKIKTEESKRALITASVNLGYRLVLAPDDHILVVPQRFEDRAFFFEHGKVLRSFKPSTTKKGLDTWPVYTGS